MARTKPRAVEPPPPAPALVASGKRVSTRASKAAPRGRSGEAWQAECWRFYNIIGEYRAAVNWVANTVSRATLYATVDTGAGPVPVAEGDPADGLLDELFNGRKGQTGMLHDLALHYSVAGEAWIVGTPVAGDERYSDTYEWGVYGYDAVRQQGDNYFLGQGKEPLPVDAVLIHTWRPHPMNPQRADAPSRAALPILAEIERLTQHVAAQVDSRLTNAGVMFFTNKMAVAATSVRAEDGTVQGTTQVGASPQDFVDAFEATAAIAIEERESAAAQIPIAVTGEPEDIAAFRHETFWSPLDEHAIELRSEAIRRLALSLDMPPEILTGTGDANHWSAWQVDESAIKSHTEPLLGQMTADLTQGYLRPGLEGEDDFLVDNPRQYAIEADTSDMRLRPNRSKEALELYDRGELSGTALLRETGFDEADAMAPEERVTWLLLKTAQGSNTPEIVAEALRLLGVPLPQMDLPDADPNEGRPSPSLEDHPSRDLPDAQSAALLAASEQMVYRALERAGNRIRNRTRSGPEGVAAAEVYLFTQKMDGPLIDHALEDAWTQVPRFADDHGVSAPALTRALDSYCRSLMEQCVPYVRGDLAQHLAPLR